MKKSTNNKEVTKKTSATVETVETVDKVLTPIEIILAINSIVEKSKLDNEVSSIINKLENLNKADTVDTEKKATLESEKKQVIARRDHFKEKFESQISNFDVTMLTNNKFEFIIVWLVNKFNIINGIEVNFEGSAKVIGTLRNLYLSMGTWKKEEIDNACEVLADFVNKYIPHDKPINTLENLDTRVLKLPLGKYEKDTTTFNSKAFLLPKNMMVEGTKPMYIKPSKIKEFLPDLVSKLGKTLVWNDKGVKAKKFNDLEVIRQLFLFTFSNVLDFECDEKVKKAEKKTLYI